MKPAIRTRYNLEKKLIALSFFGLVATGYLLLNFKTSTPLSRKPNSVGFVKPVGRDIRIKSLEEEAWSQVGRDASVYKNDRVFTGSNSRAQVTLKSTDTFTVEPNSLIVITDGGERQTIEFSTGGIFAVLKKGASLFVKHGAKETVYSTNSEATIRLVGNAERGLKLVVLKGEAEVKRADKSVSEKVIANSELEVSDSNAKPTTTPVTLLSPEPGADIWAQEGEVEFKWRADSSGRALVEISDDPTFSRVLMALESDVDRLSVKLPNRSSYFWRVAVGQSRSVVSSFGLQALIAPVINTFSELEVTSDPAGRSIEETKFVWNDQMGSEEYQLDISSSRNFESLTESKRVLETSVQISSLPIGRHFWRVRSKARGRGELISDIGELLLKSKQHASFVAQLDAVPVETPVAPTPLPDTAHLNLHVAQVEELPVVDVVKEEQKVADLPPSRRADEKIKSRRISKIKTENIGQGQVIEPIPGKVITSDVKSTENKQKLLIRKPASVRKHDGKTFFWAGTGPNSQILQQSLPQIEGQLKFNKAEGRALSVRIGYSTEDWGFDAFYADAPGEIKSPSVSVSNGAYHWRTFSIEGARRIVGQYRLRIGLQSHEIPFMILDSASGYIDITSNRLTLATVGLDRTYRISDSWATELIVRYQYPIGVGARREATYEVSPILAFDGTLGTYYKLSQRLRLGAYWYGQWHEYDYVYRADSASLLRGKQTLYYSSFELRFGFEF